MHFRYLLLPALLWAGSFTALAQTAGVGIGTTAPDASAALDIVSSSRGALLPRVANATAIAAPATGLIVFQTGGTPGFYYNAGTPAAPSWQQLATAAGAALTASNGLSKTGQDVALGGNLTGPTTITLNNQPLGLLNGRVGIGNPTFDPAAVLDVNSNNQGVLLPRLYDINQVRTSFGGAPEGLLLYQSSLNPTAPAGFYYNPLSSSTPNWQRLLPASEALAPVNGLSRTGYAVGLGGTLQQATTLDLNGNSLAVQGGSSQQISQLLANDIIGGNANGYGPSQSFLLPTNAVPTRIEVYPVQLPGAPPSTVGTFALYQGGLGGPVVFSKPLEYATTATGTPLSIDLTLPAQPGGTYVFSTGVSFPFQASTGNPYANGAAYDSNGYSTTRDLKFVVYYTLNATPTLYASSGQVGVGTTAPTARLDVDGAVRLRTLAGGGLLTADANGVLGSAGSGSGTFVLNQTASAQAGGFRLSGNGVLGGALGLGTATPTGLLHLFSPSGYTTSFQPNNTLGQRGYGEMLLGNGGLTKAASIQVSDDTQFGGGLYFNVHATTGSDNWPTGTTTALALKPDGAVGIGTTTPAQKLDVSGSATVSGSVGIGTTTPGTRLSISPGTTEAKITLYEGGGADHYGFGVSGGQLNYHVLSTSDQHVFYAKGRNASAGSVELMRVQGNGRVGIGTSNPIAPLHVSGSASATPGGAKTYFGQGSTALTTEPSTAARGVVAYFTGGQFWVNDYIVAGALNVTSDRRIKRVIGLSDRAADLSLLQKIRITDYTYIDQHANTDKVVKKVIAQEVKEVLPAAVSQSRQAIPNVYERAASVSFADGVITLRTAKPHELPATGGTLRLYTPANRELTVAATVLDAHTVRFASAEAHADGLFVYGKFVDDFLSVDYDALTTLNVSATQELARRLEALEQRNATLETRAAASEARAAADHAALQTVQQQLARLLGEAPAGPQARR